MQSCARPEPGRQDKPAKFHEGFEAQMQAGIMPARLPDSMPMPPMCQGSADRAPARSADAGALLSQCTTEYSRFFIASRIAPRPSGYTAALTADLTRSLIQQQSESAYCSPEICRLTASQARFNLRDDSPSSSLSTSPAESPVSDHGSPDLARHLRKVASCAVTARERSSRKRVQFADEVGLALTRVKFLSEPCHFTLGSCGSAAAAPSPEVTQPADGGPQLSCKFPQPSSKYIMFREAVERNHVSLNLVHLDFATIRGAVAVKNVSFRKRVFARVSLDSWHSFRDVEAAYNGSEGPQDTFVFSVQVPSDQADDVQFCVCFESDAGAHWDSNGGENYRVAVSRSGDPASSGYTRDFKPNYAIVGAFAEFSAWEHFTDRVYY